MESQCSDYGIELPILTPQTVASASKDNSVQQVKHYKALAVAVFSIMTIATVFLYLGARIWLFYIAAYAWQDKILALLLLAAELFTMIHTLGYFQSLYLVSTHTKDNIPFRPDNIPLLKTIHPSPLLFLRSRSRWMYWKKH